MRRAMYGWDRKTRDLHGGNEEPLTDALGSARADATACRSVPRPALRADSWGSPETRRFRPHTLRRGMNVVTRNAEARPAGPWLRGGGLRPCGFPPGFLPVLLASLLIVAGCSGVKNVSETVYSGNGIKVRLVEQVQKNGEPVAREFEHPWTVDTAELDGLLGSILYQQTVMFYHGKKKNAFPVSQRREMLKPIQEAFAKATPNQAVDFSFHHRWKWLIISRDMLTDGILFRKEGKLNCAFRNLAFEDLADPEGSGEPYGGDPTEEPVRSSWVLFLSPGQDLVKKKSSGLFGGTRFPNWIQLDLARQWPVASEGAEEARPEDSGDAEPVSLAEIEKRLNFLEELHKEGAVSDASYEKKKADLLELRDQASVPVPKP
jgi:hypothetical protein